ncbi:MAG: beta-CASP ribonuclease aCPSF1 [Nitrososphaerales archaeon]
MGQRLNSTQNTLINTVFQNIPPEAEITRVEYEGPRIALYTRKPKFLLENSAIISEIVNTLKKRVVLRTDKSIRKPEPEAKSLLSSKIPPQANVTAIIFDDALGEVIVEAENPKALTQEQGLDQYALVEEIGWKLRIRKASHIQSPTMQWIYHTLKSSSEERMQILRSVGERIFRSRLTNNTEIVIYFLGASQEVGRSAILVKTPESRILIDCGINPGTRTPPDAYPRLDWVDLDLDELDAVVISHAHIDHQGFLPVLFKYGYDGPVYCTEPSLPLMTLLQNDFVKVSTMSGSRPLYELRDVREVVEHCITLPYGVVTDVSPDVKLVLNNAGHILGSATVHLHIGEGAHNIVYTSDFKYAKTMLLDSASWNFPRVETLIVESTYGAKEDIMPTREEAEQTLANSVNETLSNGGKVLIPTPAVGRAQEIMLILDSLIRSGAIVEAPIFTEGMLSDATAIHISHPEYLAKELREGIIENGVNPFLSEYITNIEHPSHREEALREGPAIIMATSGMLEGGPVIEYLPEIASSEKNKILFVSYQIQGTLGRRLLDGARQISLAEDGDKIRLIDVLCKVEKIDGFSGHSDYNQIIKYISKLRPKLKQVIVNHGEKRKVESLKISIQRLFKLPVFSPSVQESIKVY